MITQVSIENLPSYELGMEKGLQKGMEQGIETVIKQLLTSQSPEQVANLIHVSLDKIMHIKNKTEH
jgi:hypothetical protein